MPKKYWTGLAAVALAGLLAAPAAAAPGQLPMMDSGDVGDGGGAALHWDDSIIRESLAHNDGWGSAGGGTRGGSNAAEDHVWTVETREELVDALARAGGEPSIVVVSGQINMNTVDGVTKTCQDYADPEYDWEEYLEDYTAHQESRARSSANQLATIRLDIPSNVTIVGEPGAALTGAQIMIDGQKNVIIRNLELRGLSNCFPERNQDGWVSEGYDYISLIGTTNVWIDHVTIEGPYVPGVAPETAMGFTVHRVDGLIDITDASDLVTVSWSEIHGGSTSLLHGNSDTNTGDQGKLRVTWHHNLFANLAERAPRVRYGQVHAYNNLYVIPDAAHYVYSWGPGVSSSIWVNDNAFRAVQSVTPDQIIANWGGTHIHVGKTLFNGEFVDVFAEYKKANPDSSLVRYDNPAPPHVLYYDDVRMVPALVGKFAGADAYGDASSGPEKDTTRPETTLVSPRTAGPFNTLSIQVDAVDDVGLERIVANVYRGEKLVRSTQTAAAGATTASHSASVDLPDGTYSIRYNSQDTSGNVSQTHEFVVSVDGTAPTVTLRTDERFTTGGPQSYSMVSYKLYDAQRVDRVALNGTKRNLSDNNWSDINFIRPGRYGATVGENTLVVYDDAGSSTTVTFTLTS